MQGESDSFDKEWQDYLHPVCSSRDSRAVFTLMCGEPFFAFLERIAFLFVKAFLHLEPLHHLRMVSWALHLEGSPINTCTEQFWMYTYSVNVFKVYTRTKCSTGMVYTYIHVYSSTHLILKDYNKVNFSRKIVRSISIICAQVIVTYWKITPTNPISCIYDTLKYENYFVNRLDLTAKITITGWSF